MKTFYTEPKASEREYQQLEKLGKKLGVPVPSCFLEMEVTLPDGQVTHHHKQRSHSWTRNMYNYLFTNTASKAMNDTGGFGAGLLSLEDTTTAVHHYASLAYIAYLGYSGMGATNPDGIPADNGNIGLRATAGLDTSGILVGTGTDAEDFEGCALATRILNGNVSGTLAYQTHNPPVETYDAPSKTISVLHVRFINNNSGADIDVNETAMVYLMIFPYNALPNIMMARDLLGAPVTVPNTGQLKVSYTINMVYPH